MIARVARFEGGNDDEIRRMGEEGPPDPPAGVSRILVLSTGTERLFITFFDSREAAAAAEARFEAMGDEVSEDVRGRRTSVEVYEVLYEGQP